ncbi:MAG: hypothetical protein KJ583_01075 [Nanoarchaeota archaeon]|nr:hypothetical protein [Nanoarchaeota archaeon]MBU1603883.1 hypothetical protein [Nanoarchaeota archaeon]
MVIQLINVLLVRYAWLVVIAHQEFAIIRFVRDEKIMVMIRLLNKKLLVVLVVLILLSMPVFAAFFTDRWYLDSASADQSSYNCAVIDNSNRENFRCDVENNPCVIDEGKTYWMCTQVRLSFGSSSSCDDNGLLGACFYQLSYMLTPPPSLQLLDLVRDGSYIKARIIVGQTTQDDIVVKAVYDRWSPLGEIFQAFDPIGYFKVKNILSEKHGCYAIDMSDDSGFCSPVLKGNDNIKGWRIDPSLGVGVGASMLSSVVRADNSIWSPGRLSVGDNVLTPSILINKSGVNVSTAYFNQTGNLTVFGVVNNSLSGIVVLNDDVNVNGGLIVNGTANLGSVPFLRNTFEPITLNASTNFSGKLNVKELTAFTAKFTNLNVSNLSVNVNFNVRQDFVSDAHIRAGKFMGAVMLGGDCIKDNGDGGLSVSFGCT